MAGSHQLLRLDEETTEQLAEPVAAALLQRFEQALDGADVVVLSDYAKGVLGDAVLAGVLARAKAAGCLVVADPKRADFAAYRGAAILTPNEHEVRLATRIGAEHDAEADRAGRAALDATGGEAVLVTRSANGLTLVRRGCPALHLPARAAKWPMFPAPAILWLRPWRLPRRRASLPDAAMLANLTAGISVGKQGTATVSAQELLGALHLEDLVATDGRWPPRTRPRPGLPRGAPRACASASPMAAST